MDGQDPAQQIEEGRMLGANLADEDPRVFVTNADEPAEGRAFVWTRMGWFERVEQEDGDGAVGYSPLSMDEDELREWLREQDLDITELDDAFARSVRDEFLNEGAPYLEAPELSNQEYRA